MAERNVNSMEMVDLSRLIYDGMPKIPVLPDVHVQKFLSLEKGHPLNVTGSNAPWTVNHTLPSDAVVTKCGSLLVGSL